MLCYSSDALRTDFSDFVMFWSRIIGVAFAALLMFPVVANLDSEVRFSGVRYRTPPFPLTHPPTKVR
jgi:hypothetical protein